MAYRRLLSSACLKYRPALRAQVQPPSGPCYLPCHPTPHQPLQGTWPARGKHIPCVFVLFWSPAQQTSQLLSSWRTSSLSTVCFPAKCVCARDLRIVFLMDAHVTAMVVDDFTFEVLNRSGIGIHNHTCLDPIMVVGDLNVIPKTKMVKILYKMGALWLF